MLEYFEGILFLTTNRLDHFDKAFQSRIHLTRKLPDLGREQRQSIWEGLIRYNSKLADGERWTTEAFEALGGLEVNARVLRYPYSLCIC